MLRLLTGLVAAPHSPFTAAGGLNLEVVGRYADHLLESGVTGAFICGSTGEGYSLTTEERKELAARWCAVAAGRLRVVVHVGSLCLAESRELAAHAQQVGADAIATAPPCYFRPEGQDNLIAWLAEIAAAAPALPLYYYHVPTMTGVQADVAALLAAGSARIPTLAGAKFTDQDLMGFAESVRLDGGRFNLLYGFDEMLLPALAVGAEGGVGSTYNYAAPLYHRVISAFAAGNLEEAREWQARAIALIRLLSRSQFMAASKALTGIVGINCGPVRPPLRPFSPRQTARLREELEAMGFFDWLRAAKERW